MLSYKVYAPEAYAYLVFPWLILVLWLRWLPKWTHSVLFFAIGLMVFPPIAAVIGLLDQEARALGSLAGPLLAALLVVALRPSTPAAASAQPLEPDSRWKLLLAFAGSFAIVVALGVLAPDGKSTEQGDPLTEFKIVETEGPAYVEDFKRAMDGRDAWAAYAAYREAERYRDLEAIRPVIDLYSDLGDSTGIAFGALEARREGRSEDRRRLETSAAEKGEPLGMVLALESIRSEATAKGKSVDSITLTSEARAYRRALLELREYNEVYLACYGFYEREQRIADACVREGKPPVRVTALVSTHVAIMQFDGGVLGPKPLILVATTGFLDGLGRPDQWFGDPATIPEISSAKALGHRAASWPGKFDYPITGSLESVISDLREGVRLENPEAGLLLHQASFRAQYRDLITPEEARGALQMAADWGHPDAMKTLSQFRENGVGGFNQDRVLALALLLARERYLDRQDPSGLEDANRIGTTLTEYERKTAEFTAKNWRPGYLMVLFDPALWDGTTAE